MSRFLYLDDAEPKDVKTFVDALHTAATDLGLELVIDIRKPPTDLRVDRLLNQLKPDGVLIDVELSKALDDAQRPYPMTGTALAQNIRDNQNAKDVLEIPLVRLSQRDVVRRYVGKDHTSLDLFDRYFDKAEVRIRAAQFAESLVALDRGYRKLVASKPIQMRNFVTLLDVPKEIFDNLHSTLILRFIEHDGAPAHDVARFIFNSLLEHDGPLIREATLAARLGIDPIRSGEAWKQVLKTLDHTRYSGVFATDSDPRWWADHVSNWWDGLKSDTGLFINSTGEERCKLIGTALNLSELRAIAEDSNSPGPYYWTTCIESGRPLDPMNAYAVMPEPLQSEWHDVRYMCREEAFQRAHDPRFDAAERERILQDRG